MIYAEHFQDQFSARIGMLNAFAALHADPMVYAAASGEVVGCNELLMGLFEKSGITQIAQLEEWFEPEEGPIASLLEKSWSGRGKIAAAGKEYTVDVRSEPIKLEELSVIGIVFRDVSIIERAKKAERYFQDFKKKFLVNISHEFRTPMNAIIGFTDLLKNTPLNPHQREYVDMTSQSAISMMRNIENLLELTQVESGAVHSNLVAFNPLEIFENFSQQFCDLALSKQIQLMFLIDPHLPKTMTGDQDKIETVLRNLIQNAIKFTEEGGRVLVEILVKHSDAETVEVEYAVTDTGVGIEAEKIKTLLRPFASSLERERKGKDGLGIGLSLSHKYVDLMHSHLMLASEKGKGARFSFRITHQIGEKGAFDFVEGTKAAIYAQDPHLSSQGALLYKYLELFSVKAKVVHDLLENGDLQESDILFLDIPHVSPVQIDSIRSGYPSLRIVPILKAEYGVQADPAVIESADSVVTLPIMPGALHKTLAVIWEKMPKEYIAQSPEIQHVPVQASIKILVAEDNLINLRLLETILQHEKFQVVAVDNGQKAVDAYLKEPFDLVLMDIDMPVMDGLTANRLIKEIDRRDKRPTVPVIALTAHALLGDRERIVAAGLDAHLAKPIDKHFLLQTIDRYLKIARQKEQHKSV